MPGTPRPSLRDDDSPSSKGGSEAQGPRGHGRHGRPAAALPIDARRHPLVSRLAGELDRLLGGGSRPTVRGPWLVAVSGGADSSALAIGAAVLAGRRRDPWPAPRLVHVHHHLRGADADADAASVAELAERLGIPFERLDIQVPADGNRLAAARTERYEALRAAAESAGAGLVLTAHHADDQLESVLLDLARGVGRNRLGMPAVRGLPGRGGVRLVRPLLRVPRSELLDCCRSAGHVWRRDPSNLDPDRARTTIRGSAGPALESLHPGAAARIAATVERIDPRGDDDRVPGAFDGDDASDRTPAPGPDPAGTVTWDRPALARLPAEAIAARLRAAAVLLAPAAGDRLGRRQLEAAAALICHPDAHSRQVHWAGALEVRIDGCTVELRSATSEANPRTSTDGQ